MEEYEYSNLARRESFYFWNIGRREILRDALRRHLSPSLTREILDIGCGPGGNILILQEFGRVTGLDISESALSFAKNRGFARLISASAENIPFPDASFDMVSALDMLEHVEEQEKVLAGAFRILKTGGIFLVTVPAHPWLWSAHDEALHHLRRYAQKDIILKLEKAGFRVLEKSHFVTVAVLVNYLRLFRDKIFSGAQKKDKAKTYDVEFPVLLNSLLLFILRCEKVFIRFFSIPLGSSLMLVVQKP